LYFHSEGVTEVGSLNSLRAWLKKELLPVYEDEEEEAFIVYLGKIGLVVDMIPFAEDEDDGVLRFFSVISWDVPATVPLYNHLVQLNQRALFGTFHAVPCEEPGHVNVIFRYAFPVDTLQKTETLRWLLGVLLFSLMDAASELNTSYGGKWENGDNDEIDLETLLGEEGQDADHSVF